MSIMKWLKKKAALIGLALANVEQNILSQKGGDLDINPNQERRHTQGTLMDALINGEVTEEVENLRWRIYKISKEVDNYKSNILSFNGDSISVETKSRKVGNSLSKISVDTIDSYPVEFIQANVEIFNGSSVMDNENIELYDTPVITINDKDDEKTATHGEIKGIEYFATTKTNKILTIDRECLPRFDIERYTEKIVVRKISEDERLLELYVSKYPDEFNRTSRLFISDIKKLIATPRKSDILDIKNIKFITSNAIGVDNFLEYDYNVTSFDKIIEFGGHYVIKFKATVLTNGEPILDKFRKASLDEKYNNKEAKNRKYEYNLNNDNNIPESK